MKLFSHFKNGACGSLTLWKWILVVWVVNLILVSFPALTLRSEMNSIFGKSMITEKLSERSIADAFANTGTSLRILISSFRTGFLLVLMSGILINIFLEGGLFATLRKDGERKGSAAFFSGASGNFWSYLVTGSIAALIISFVGFIIIGVPAMIRLKSATGGNPGMIKLTILFFMIILPVCLLVADYARAWQAASEKKDSFRALGNGFKHTFRHFFSSYIVMLIIVIIQILYTLIVFRLTGGLKPESSGGIFLLFLLIQLLFIIKLFLRTWRYGCVTSMYEEHNS